MSRKIYLKMLIQAVGVPVLEFAGALGLRRGLRLLHPWNTKGRAFRRGAAEAVSESRQHGARPIAVARFTLLFLFRLFPYPFPLLVFSFLSLPLLFPLFSLSFRSVSLSRFEEARGGGFSRAADSRRRRWWTRVTSYFAARHHRENDQPSRPSRPSRQRVRTACAGYP